MGRKKDLSATEKKEIVQLLARGKTTLEISKILRRDHRTVKNAMEDVNKKRVRSKGKGFKNISDRDNRKLKQIITKHPLLSSAEVFDKAGISGVKRDKRCRILQTMSTVKKSVGRPPLNKTHKQKRLDWARENLKTDFSKVIFTDESRVTLDGPDGWSKGWVLCDKEAPPRLRRQQGGGGIMIWAGIVDDKVIGPFKVDEGVKLNSDNYCALLEGTFFKWYKSQSRKLKKDCVFMQDNAPSHASRSTSDFLARKGLTGSKLMKWPSSSPDLNPIENMWALVKRELYSGGKQYSNKSDLWEAIKKATQSIKPETVKSLTNSMDDRLFKIIDKKGGYINM